MIWLAASWHKLGIVLTNILIVVVHWEDLVEKGSKILGFKKWIVRQIGERRHTMLNPITIVTDINLAITAIQKVQAALPQIQKTVNDIKQAGADKSDTTKLDADLVALFADVNEDLVLVAGLFPTSPVTAPTVATVPPTAA